MKRGFTLVELSIVLVIIGLLIGGILAAQSMVSATKIQSQIRQIQQFDTAVSNFKTKYNGLPGDIAAMGCASGFCGNGRIDDNGGNAGGGTWIVTTNWGWANAGSELMNFWPDLQKSGFTVPGVTFSNDDSFSFSVTPPTQHSPKALIGKNVGIIIYMDNYWLNPEAHYYWLADWHKPTHASPTIRNDVDSSVRTIDVVDALALDKKMDDGLPNAGVGNGLSNLYG